MRPRSQCLAQCVETYREHGGNVIAVEEVPPEETHQYGVVSVGQDFGRSFEITGMVEKPAKGTAPSNLIISGRYILQPEIFALLEKVEKGAGGEIQLTDGMKALSAGQPFHGVRFDGRTYDCGSKIGFLTANLAFALERPELADALRAEAKKARPLARPSADQSRRRRARRDCALEAGFDALAIEPPGDERRREGVSGTRSVARLYIRGCRRPEGALGEGLRSRRAALNRDERKFSAQPLALRLGIVAFGQDGAPRRRSGTEPPPPPSKPGKCQPLWCEAAPPNRDRR